MKDRAGQIYSGIGGVLAGAGLSTLLAGAVTTFLGWTLFLTLVACAVTFVGLYMLIGSLADWWLPGRRKTLALVIDDARELSASIFSWVGERKRMDSGFYPHRQDTWEADTQRIMRQSDEGMIRWNELYAVRALTAYDRLVAHGAVNSEGSFGGRHTFEHPTNRLGIEQIARTLGVMAAELEMKKMTRR